MEKSRSLFSFTRAIISQQLWGVCQPQENELSLSRHRQQSEKKIAELNLPKQLQFQLTSGLLLLEQAYNDAFQWLNIYEEKIESLKYHKLDIIQDIHYRFSNFITPMGEFDDLNWVKQFVNDEQQCLFDRFYFACFYCFEEKVRILWPQVLEIGWYPNINYKSVRYRGPALVSYWIHHLEDKEAELLGSFTPSNIFNYGFVAAINAGSEKAVHYFWDKLANQEHTSPLNDIIDYAKTICGIAYQGNPKILHFLYSRLNPQQQQRVLQYNLQQNRYPSIWCCYLQPSLISFIPEQITLHQSSLPPKAFLYILFHLACKIREIGSPMYRQLFHTVWKLGSPENKDAFLQDDRLTLPKLLRTKEFSCARELLKETSPEQKKFLLFKTAKEFLIFRRFLYKKDLSAIRNYLLLFLTDLHQENTTSPLIPFHGDSLNLLKEFREKSYFAKYYLKDTSEENTQFLLSILENLSIEISNFLKGLLQKVESSVEQHNQVRSLSKIGFLSTSTSRKRTHSDEHNAEVLHENNSAESEENLMCSPSKRIKVSTI